MMFLKYDSNFNFIFTKIADLFILNILFILCCLPIFTIGASYSALYECITLLKDDSSTSLWIDFFRTFKLKFKYSCISQIIIMISTIALWSNLVIMLSLNSIVKFIFIIFLAFYFILLISFSIYVFPILCRYNMKLSNLLKVTFVIAIGNPIKTLLLILINLFPLIIMSICPFLNLYIIVFMTFFGFSLISFLSSLLLEPLFKNISISIN